MEIPRTGPQSNIQPINKRLYCRERNSSTSKQLPRIGESACHLFKWVCDFQKLVDEDYDLLLNLYSIIRLVTKLVKENLNEL